MGSRSVSTHTTTSTIHPGNATIRTIDLGLILGNSIAPAYTIPNTDLSHTFDNDSDPAYTTPIIILEHTLGGSSTYAHAVTRTYNNPDTTTVATSSEGEVCGILWSPWQHDNKTRPIDTNHKQDTNYPPPHMVATR